MIRQPLGRLGPVLLRDLHALEAEHHPAEGLLERHLGTARARRRRELLGDLRPHLGAHVRGRHQLAAHPLGQRPDRGHAQLGAHPRHQPVEALRGQAPQYLHRHLDADPVLGVARLEHVVQAQGQVPLHPRVREAARVAPAGQQQLPGEVQQVRGGAPLLLPPGVEGRRGGHLLGDPVVIEVEQGGVVGQQPVLAPTPLHVLKLLDELPVALHEAVPGVPAALHQTRADEHLPGHLAGRVRPHARQRRRPVRHQRHPVEQHLLVNHGRPLAGRPVGLTEDVAGQARPVRHLLDPPGVHLGHRAGEEPGGLHQLGGHHPVVGLAAQARARPDREARPARAGVLPTTLIPVPHIGQQPHQQRAVDRIGVGRVRTAPQGHDSGRHTPVGDLGGMAARLQGLGCRPDRTGRRQLHRGRVQAQRSGQLAQLGVDVLPLAHPQVVQELGPAHAPEGRAGQLAALRAQVAPQVQVGQEVTRRVREAPVQGVGGLLLVRRALAHVLDGQGRHDDHDLPDTAQLTGLQEHAPQARVDGQARQAPPDLRQARPTPAPVGGVVGSGRGGRGRLDGADLREQLQAGADLAGVGGVQEGEVLHRPQPQGRHLQNDAGQRGAQDLRLGVLRARLEVGLRVQADGDAVGHAPATARPLVGAGPADRLDRQALNLGAVGVAGDARQARVDDVPDPGNRQGGLGHVRGQDDAAHLVGLEDPVLLGGAQTRVQGNHLNGTRRA